MVLRRPVELAAFIRHNPETGVRMPAASERSFWCTLCRNENKRRCQSRGRAFCRESIIFIHSEKQVCQSTS